MLETLMRLSDNTWIYILTVTLLGLAAFVVGFLIGWLV